MLTTHPEPRARRRVPKGAGWILAFALFTVFSVACGGSSDEPPKAPNPNSWDQMNWDQGTWQ